MIKYGVVSYHRPECATIRTLLEIGVPRDRILISLNDKNDIPDYMNAWGDGIEIYCATKFNVAGNRNNVLDYVGDEWDIVILDDDQLSFRLYDPTYKKSGRWVKIETVDELDGCLSECFEKAKEIGADYFGTTSVTHCLTTKQTMEKDGKWSVNKNFNGGLLGFVNRGIRFNETYDLEEDYELNLRVISQGRRILRRNGLATYTKLMTKTPGGCKEFYDAGLKPAILQRLTEEYPGMIRVNKDGRGIRFTWR